MAPTGGRGVLSYDGGNFFFFFFFRAYTNSACHRPVACANALAFYLTPETRHDATAVNTNKEIKAVLLSFVIGV